MGDQYQVMNIDFAVKPANKKAFLKELERLEEEKGLVLKHEVVLDEVEDTR